LVAAQVPAHVLLKQEATLGNLRKGRRSFTELPVESWNIYHFWNWFFHSSDFPVIQILRPEDRGKLRHLVSGVMDHTGKEKPVTIPELKRVSYELIKNFGYFSAAFGWEITNKKPFTPGILLAFWPAILAVMDSSRYQSQFREYVPESFIKPIYTPDSDGGGVRIINISDFFETPEVVCSATGGKVKDWKTRPHKSWSVTTVWAYVTDNLNAKEIGVVRLGKHRITLKRLIEKHSMPKVIAVTEVFVDRAYQCFRKLNLHKPLHPRAYCGFWPGIRDLAENWYPHLYDMIAEA
jgi:hypothetical protein